MTLYAPHNDSLLPSPWVCGCNSTLCAVTVTNSFLALCTPFTVNLCKPHCDFRCFHNDTQCHSCPYNVSVWPSPLLCIPSQWVCVPQKWLYIWPPQCHFVTYMMTCVPTNDFVYIHSDSVCSNNDSVWCGFFVDPLNDTVTSQWHYVTFIMSFCATQWEPS